MADRMGSYHGAFYLAASAVILGAGIPFFLPFIKRRTVYHGDKQGQTLHTKLSKHQIVERSSQENDFPCHDIPSFAGNLDTSYNVEEAISPRSDVKRTMITTSSSGVNNTALPHTEGNTCSSNTKSEENNRSSPLWSESGTEPSVTETSNDELINNKTQMPETSQSNTHQLQVEVNSLLEKTTKMDNEQETTEANVDDTKL